MSEAAARKHEIKRHWAEPGGLHDRVIQAIKYGLPIVIIVLLILLAIAPFERRGDVSFILDKNKVDEAKERMRVEQARYVGEDNKGQKFEIVADRAVQQSSNVPVVTRLPSSTSVSSTVPPICARTVASCAAWRFPEMAGPLANSACDTTTTFSVPTVVGAGADSAFASPASPRLHPANVTAVTAIAIAIEPTRIR